MILSNLPLRDPHGMSFLLLIKRKKGTINSRKGMSSRHPTRIPLCFAERCASTVAASEKGLSTQHTKIRPSNRDKPKWLMRYSR